MAALEPVARPLSLSDMAYHQLRAGILAGEFKHGDRLSVVTLAERLSISRSPVRSAVERLSAEGLLTIDALGIELVGYNRQDLLDSLAVRQPLEVLAARLAAEHATDEGLAELRAIYAKFLGAVDHREETAAYGLDVGFHQTLWSICGNPVLEQELQRLHARGVVASFTTAWVPLHVEAVSEHGAIHDAVIAGDAEAAGRAAAVHMDELIARVRTGSSHPAI